MLSRRSVASIWEANYHKRTLPWDYGLIDPTLEAVLDSMTREEPGQALDIGCGTGTEVLALNARGFRTIGVDIARNALARAVSKSPASAARFVQANAVDLPFKDESFDFVLDKGCSHFLPREDLSDFGGQVWRVLRSRGIFVMYCSSDHDHTVGPFQMSRAQIQFTFGRLFRILWLDLITLAHHHLKPRAYFAGFQKTEEAFCEN